MSDAARLAYDTALLKARLSEAGNEFVYLPETTSTMDVAREQGVRKAVVLTDHQTQGRGRYARSWEDEPGSSILVTFTRVLARVALPPVGSLRLAHCFVLAVWQALGSDRVGIKWPNDLYVGGRKLGGVLVAEGDRDETTQAVLFGVGINILPRRPDTASVSEIVEVPDRSELVVAISSMLDTFLADIGRLSNPEVAQFYDELWQRASILVGRDIRVTSEGAAPIEGTVTESPFGGNLQLQLRNGDIIEVSEYGSTAHIEMLPQ